MRCLIRGGNWNNGANAGVFNSNLNNARSNSNVNVGGRSAFRPKALNVRHAAPDMWAALYGARSGARTKRGLLPFLRKAREEI